MLSVDVSRASCTYLMLMFMCEDSLMVMVSFFFDVHTGIE
jgi:hypothetical protein